MSPLPSGDIRSLACASPTETHARDELSKVAIRQALARGEQLFEESGAAYNLYQVIEGVLKSYKLLLDGRCQVTGFLFPGDFVGIEHSGNYAYSVDAVTPCTVARYRSNELRRLLERDDRLREWLLGVVVHELTVAQDQMLLLSHPSAEQRLAAFLLKLSERAAARCESDSPVYVPMTCADTGDFLGLTAETISRMYTRLFTHGIISRRVNYEVRIFDRQALFDIVRSPSPTRSYSSRQQVGRRIHTKGTKRRPPA